MDTSNPTSLGGLRPSGQGASLLDLGGHGGDNSLIIVGNGSESPGNAFDFGGELRFLKKAADLQLYASVVPATIATYDLVLDGPIVVPVVAQYFDKVAAVIMRTISQEMAIEVKTAKVDREGLRLTMRLRCIPLQVELLEHRFPGVQILLVMHEEAVETAETAVEDGQATV